MKVTDTSPAHLFAPPLPGSDPLPSERMEIAEQARNRSRQVLEQDMAEFRKLMLIVSVIIPVVSFLTLYGIAAVVDRGIENIQAYRVGGLPT